MKDLIKVRKVKYEEGFRQFADREDAQKYMKEKGYKAYKVIAEYKEYIEVIFATELELESEVI